MKPSGYATYEEFLLDKEKLTKHPNDEALTDSIVRKIKLTEKTVRDQIEEELSGKMMVDDFHRFISREIKNVDPKYYVVIKSKDDPWFEC